MKPQHIIYLSGSSVVLYTWDRAKYVPVAGYELPDGDPAPLVTYLGQTPAAVVAILVDVLEEEHSRDTLPRLGRSDQSAMLARKLARAFPRTAYRTAAVQGRVPGDPQTSRILLSGLTKADHLRTLAGLLAAAKLPVATVCSPALLSRTVLDKLRPADPADATLLVSRQREGSLRLSFFRGRDLAGSRLIRRSLAAPPGDMPRLVRQLEESVRYFDAAFTPGASNPIDVLLLCELDIDPAAATAEGTGHDGFRLHVPDPVIAARKLGFATGQGPQLQPGNGDLLFVELLRRSAPAGNFAPPAERRYLHLHQIRVFGKAASLAIAAASLAGASLNAVELLTAGQQVADARRSVTELTALLQNDSGDAGTDGMDPLGMEQAVTTWRVIDRHGINPAAVLALVSTALEGQPRVQLDGLKWSPLTDMALAADDGASGDSEVTASATDESGGDSAGQEGAPAESDQVPYQEPESGVEVTPRVRISLKGRVEPFNGDYRQAFAELQTFIDVLRADQRVLSVTARKQPLDVSPRSTLSGEVNPALPKDQATFTVDLLVRFTDGPA